jgi:hypothetical protein
MAGAVQRLDLTVGELVEVDGRRYEVVPDEEGGVTIEPPITLAAELHTRRGTSPRPQRTSSVSRSVSLSTTRASSSSGTPED